MGEIIRLVPKDERQRARLVRRARAIYDSIFPPTDPVSKRQNKATVSNVDGGAKAHRNNRGRLP
jgi:hypothetical protein